MIIFIIFLCIFFILEKKLLFFQQTINYILLLIISSCIEIFDLSMIYQSLFSASTIISILLNSIRSSRVEKGRLRNAHACGNNLLINCFRWKKICAHWLIYSLRRVLFFLLIISKNSLVVAIIFIYNILMVF